jgi:CBS domain-containing protein
LEALTVMDKYNLNSVAVVDEGDGSLVANTSGSDLGVFLSGRNSLHMPVLDFFAEVLPYLLPVSFVTISPVACTPDDDVWSLYIQYQTIIPLRREDE